MIPRPEFGGYALDDPRLGELLDRLAIEEQTAQVQAALDAQMLVQRQREMNESIYIRAIDNWIRSTTKAAQ